MRAFNFPSPNQTQGTRPESTVPQQALFLMNSPIVIDQAKALAANKGFKAAKTKEDKVAWLFQRVYQRDPGHAGKRLIR